MSTDLLTTMRQRLADAEADADRLRAAIAVLEHGGGNRNAQPAAKPRRRQAAKATPSAVVPPGKITAALSEHTDGVTTSTLANLLDGDQSQILGLLKEAEAEGSARREGQRRATRWFVVTDEHRIAARATELEAQRSAAGHKAAATKGPERRSQAPMKANASRSPEQRSEAATKAAATRKAKAEQVA